MDVFIDQLQTVTVTGNDHTLPTIVGADFTHCADYIVRFPALAFINRNVHGTQDVFHNRHLHGQFFRHAVAGGLVAVIFQMAEGGPMKVKRNADRIGLFFLLHAL